MNLWRVLVDEESGETQGEPEPVTTGGASFHRHMTFSRDGNRKAYVEHVQSRNLWKVAFDTTTGTIEGEPIPVTRGSTRIGYPNISPDSRWLAYFSAGKQEDIFIIRTDGSGRRRLTDDPYKDRFPRWSPDGRKLAFISNRSGTYEAWTIHADGSGLRQLTDAPDMDIGGGVWSPDGSRMAYADHDRTGIFDPSLPWKEQTPLILPPLAGAFLFEPWSWSPDGRRIAGTGISADGGSTGTFTFSLESRQYRRLTDTGWRPVRLPDGRKLLVYEQGVLSLVDYESRNRTEILAVEPDRIGGPTFSPRAPWLFFHRVKEEADIWLLTLDEER